MTELTEWAPLVLEASDKNRCLQVISNYPDVDIYCTS